MNGRNSTRLRRRRPRTGRSIEQQQFPIGNRRWPGMKCAVHGTFRIRAPRQRHERHRCRMRSQNFCNPMHTAHDDDHDDSSAHNPGTARNFARPPVVTIQDAAQDRTGFVSHNERDDQRSGPTRQEPSQATRLGTAQEFSRIVSPRRIDGGLYMKTHRQEWTEQ